MLERKKKKKERKKEKRKKKNAHDIRDFNDTIGSKSVIFYSREKINFLEMIILIVITNN